MPTNPRWLEHTERAAWDTVETLRLELERERKRLERLTQLHPVWPKLVAALDAVKGQLAIASDDYELVLARVLEVLRERTEQRDDLKLQVERLQRERDQLVGARELEPSAAPESVRLSSPVRWFARLLERKRSAVPTTGRRRDAKDVRRFIEALELKVEELAQARHHELLELAVDVGSLALSLARSVRKRAARPTEGHGE
jgi:hypothetical protein